MLTNDPTKIIDLIVANYGASYAAQARQDWAALRVLSATWEGLQAALAFSCRERGISKVEANRIADGDRKLAKVTRAARRKASCCRYHAGGGQSFACMIASPAEMGIS